MFEKIRPLNDNVWIQRLAEEETTQGGIIIPDAAKEKPQKGKVLAVGEGKRAADGSRCPLDVQVGQIVFFGKFSGTPAGDDHLILKESDILGVVEQ